MNESLKILLLVCLVYLPSMVNAEPVVIRDYGGRPSGIPSKQALVRLALQQKLRRQSLDDSARYPVRSRLRPGYLKTSQKLQVPIKDAQPLFIVGNDAFSRDWMEQNKAYLLKIRAQGVVTNIESKALFFALEAVANPLPLVAVPVDEIAELLQFSVYPVLITGEEIAQ